MRRLPPLLEGVRLPLVGVKLRLDCDEESKDLRLLLLVVRVLRKMPRRLLFFNSGGLGGFPGEIPSDAGAQGDEHDPGVGGTTPAAVATSPRILFFRGVCNGERVGNARGSKLLLESDGLCGGVCGVAAPKTALCECAIHDPTDSKEDMESLSSIS